MYGLCAAKAPKHKFRFKSKLLSLDATTIKLCLSLFPWASFRQAKGGVKVHTIIPGMTASVDILTGKKSVLDYLLKPILKARQNALRER